MGRFLLLGASGAIGRALRARLPAAETVATYHAHAFDGGVAFDARAGDPAPLLAGVEHAVVMVGETSIEACARDEAAASALNVEAVIRILEACRQAGARPVFLSTDLVFDGAAAPYAEDARPNPLVAYGRHKRAVEEWLTASGMDHTVLRLARVFGDGRGDGTVLGEWLAQIDAGETVRCATDQVFTPVHAGDAADAVVAAAEQRWPGVVHVGGPEHLTRLRMLETVIGAGGAEAAIETCRLADLGFAEPRPADTRLDTAKFHGLMGRALVRFADVAARAAQAERA